MNNIKWIKLATNLFDNKKIVQIESLPEADTIIVIWVKLLCLAGNINDNGLIYFTKKIPYTDQTLSNYMHRPLTTVQLALNIFQSYGMIEIINDMMVISNWEKYQNVEGLDKIREQTKIRVAKHRKQKKLTNSEDVTQCNATSNADVTQCNAIEEDKNKNKNKNKNKKENKKEDFVSPTLEEVENYCKERKNNIIAKDFFEYYEAGGWKDAKGNPVKNWKQKMLTWEKYHKNDVPQTIVYDNSEMDVEEPDIDAIRNLMYAKARADKKKTYTLDEMNVEDEGDDNI